ncbi:MAG: MFS transporter [Simkaniaceae bacterium]|nr:MFS transporter [Simkaniaceae bacterium]MCF7852662.1 MFS transporter [Simkaniaceae bacterium]
MPKSEKSPNSFYLVPILGCIILMYAMRFINAILSPIFMDDFHMNAAMLGFMSASFLFFAGIFQIPLSLLVSKIQPRLYLIILGLVGSLGALIFSSANTGFGLTLGRAMMGVSFTLAIALGNYIMIGIRSMKRHLTFAPIFSKHSMLLSIGLGAFVASFPAQMLVKYGGWRSLIFAMMVILIVLVILASVWISDTLQAPKIKVTDQHQRDRMYALFQMPLFKKAGFPVVIACGSFLSLQGLWLGPWLTNALGQSPMHLGYVLALSAGGIMVGQLTFRIWLYCARRCHISVFGLGVGLYGFFILILGLILIPVVAKSNGIWFFLGFSLHVNARIVIESLNELPSIEVKYLSTLLQTCAFLVGFAIEVVIGLIISCWTRSDIGQYPIIAYQSAFAAIAFINLGALLWLIFYQKNLIIEYPLAKNNIRA